MEVDAAIGRIADATGTGKASFIREMLIGSLPHLLAIAEAAELATKQQVPDSLRLLSKTLRGAVAQGEQQQLELTKATRAVQRKKRREQTV